MAKTRKSDKSIKALIDYKMRLLYDFGVCERHDTKMKDNLAAAIKARPDVDPQVVLDSYCRPIISKVMNGWN